MRIQSLIELWQGFLGRGPASNESEEESFVALQLAGELAFWYVEKGLAEVDALGGAARQANETRPWITIECVERGLELARLTAEYNDAVKHEGLGESERPMSGFWPANLHVFM